MTAERDAKVFARIVAGETYEAVARDMGLTRERIRQLFTREARRQRFDWSGRGSTDRIRKLWRARQEQKKGDSDD